MTLDTRFTTNTRKAGVSESVIMAITDHTSRSMVDRYNTIDNEDTKQAAAILTNFLNSDQISDQPQKTAFPKS